MYTNFKTLSIIISSFEINILFLLFQNSLYSKKYSGKIIYISICIIISLGLTIVTLNGFPFLNSFFMIFALCLTSIFFYNSSVKKILLYNILLVLFFILIDLIVSTVFSVVISKSLSEMLGNDLHFFVSSIPVMIAHFIGYNYFVKYIKKTEFDKTNKIEILLLLITLLFEILLLFYLTLLNVNDRKGNYIILFISAGYSIIYIMQIYLFNKLHCYYKSQNNLKLQKVQSDLLFDHYFALEQINTQQSKIIHDIKNHINTLTGLTNFKKNKQAQEYNKKIDDSLQHLNYVYIINNKPLQIIINDKHNLCSSNNIDLKLYIENCNIDFVDIYDLITILGNIFDNAIFACNSLNSNSNKKIEFRIYEFGGHIVIYMNNTANPIVRLDKKGNLLSNKKSHDGIGLKNIKDAIGKYNGYFNYEYSSHDFTVKITIPIF